jgi:hypothetical protein
MAYVIPDLRMTVVMTSDPNGARDTGHIDTLHDIVENAVVPAAKRGAS